MILKSTFCLTLLQLSFLLSLAQSNDNKTQINCAALAREYNIYEIDKVFFSFPNYGQALRFKSNQLISGKQFYRDRWIHLLTFGMFSNKKKPKGLIVKLSNTNQQIDTFLYTGIKLKYPLEVDDTLFCNGNFSNSEHQPLLIRQFQFVKKCSRLSRKHFEIITEDN